MTDATVDTVTMAPAQAPDPYRYGWRYVNHWQEDGSLQIEQAPLTLEDVLHPQEGDFMMQNALHHHICEYLFDVFSACLEHNQGAVVLTAHPNNPLYSRVVDAATAG